MTENKLWTEKYCPKSYSEFHGNLGIIKEVKKWIQSFQEKKNTKKGLIFYGSSAVGKTCLAHLALHEAGYRIVEYNCNNITDIKDMRDQVKKSLGHANILDMFSGTIKPTGVVIDEIDNISNGLNELSNMLKSDDAINAPIIFTCNNLSVKGLKALRSQCLELKLNKPTKIDMEEHIKYICEKENMDLEFDAYFLIIKKSQSDWRKLIGILQDLKSKYGDENINFDKVEKGISHLDIKDADYQLTEVVNRVFNKELSVDESEKLFMIDCAMVPLYLQENYPKAVLARSNNSMDLINKLADISLHMVEYDIISTEIYQTQDWRMTSYAGFYASTMCNFTINHNNKKLAKFIGMSSSSLLNKISQSRRQIKAWNILPINLKTTLTQWDLHILSELVVYNLFQKKGDFNLVIPLIINAGLNMMDDDKNTFTLDPINNLLSINSNKSKKLTAKHKLDLKKQYLEIIHSSSSSSSS